MAHRSGVVLSLVYTIRGVSLCRDVFLAFDGYLAGRAEQNVQTETAENAFNRYTVSFSSDVVLRNSSFHVSLIV